MKRRITLDQVDLEEAAAARQTERYVLRLYISGVTPRSAVAIRNIRRICEDHLPGRYDLEIVDIYQLPTLAEREQILAAPSLVKLRPLPQRRFVGDMSNIERILRVLDLRTTGEKRAVVAPTGNPP